jgi:hypothetical protein
LENSQVKLVKSLSALANVLEMECVSPMANANVLKDGQAKIVEKSGALMIAGATVNVLKMAPSASVSQDGRVYHATSKTVHFLTTVMITEPVMKASVNVAVVGLANHVIWPNA